MIYVSHFVSMIACALCVLIVACKKTDGFRANPDERFYYVAPEMKTSIESRAAAIFHADDTFENIMRDEYFPDATRVEYDDASHKLRVVGSSVTPDELGESFGLSGVPLFVSWELFAELESNERRILLGETPPSPYAIVPWQSRADETHSATLNAPVLDALCEARANTNAPPCTILETLPPFVAADERMEIDPPMPVKGARVTELLDEIKNGVQNRNVSVDGFDALPFVPYYILETGNEFELALFGIRDKHEQGAVGLLVVSKRNGTYEAVVNHPVFFQIDNIGDFFNLIYIDPLRGF